MDLGSVISIGSELLGGYLSYDAAQDKADAYETNAEYAAQEAKYQYELGAITEARLGRDTKRLRGSQDATYAYSGVAVGSGSAADVALDTNKEAALDAQIIRQNTEIKARGYAIGQDQASAMADNASDAAYLNAGTTLLTAYGNSQGYN